VVWQGSAGDRRLCADPLLQPAVPIDAGFSSIGKGATHAPIMRTDLFFKVEVEHEPEDPPARLAEEIRRHLLRLYGVRDAELSSFTTWEE
jgi:hypothetical protein